MTNPTPLDPLTGALADLLRLIEHYPQKAIIIGGVAASILGKPRTTADIDALFLVPISGISELLHLAEKEGFFPRLENAQEFAKESRMVLLKHKASDTDIDISLGILQYEEQVVAEAYTVSLGKLRLPLPRPEDLIIMKAVANRPKDIQDIESIIAVQDSLDLERIKTTVKEFSALLDKPAIWTDIAGYFPD